MSIFSIQAEFVIAAVFVLAFGLGWLSQRYVRSYRARKDVERLTDKVAHLEHLNDAAHRAALAMAKSHARLLSDHEETKWIIQSLKSDNRLREVRIEKLLEDNESFSVAVNEEIWPADTRYSREASSRD